MELGFDFNRDEKLALLKIAREAAEAAASGRSYRPGVPKDPKLLNKAGAFVTLRKGGELRGCIGYIEAHLPVFETVAQTGAKAAVHDPRFKSLEENELKDIEVEVSVLSPLRKIECVEEVVVGKHGLLVEKGYYHGLLLPQVAAENNWDREAFLEYTCVKAGLDKDCYKLADVNIYVFTAEVFSESEHKKSERDIVKGA
ncbi:MAG: AmmeMemoRadiSam system protein A [Candidatus Kryptoniota bacterium]